MSRWRAHEESVTGWVTDFTRTEGMTRRKPSTKRSLQLHDNMVCVVIYTASVDDNTYFVIKIILFHFLSTVGLLHPPQRILGKLKTQN